MEPFLPSQNLPGLPRSAPIPIPGTEDRSSGRRRLQSGNPTVGVDKREAERDDIVVHREVANRSLSIASQNLHILPSRIIETNWRWIKHLDLTDNNFRYFKKIRISLFKNCYQ